MQTFFRAGWYCRVLPIVAVAIAITASSCLKTTSSDNTSNEPVTETDAALALSSTMAGDNGGFADQIYTADARFRASGSYTCGKAYDSSVTRASGQGASPAWSTTLAYHWVFTCGNPASFALSFTGTGNYSGQYTAASDSCSGNLTASGFEGNTTVYSASGNYSRKGNFAIVTKTFTRNLTMTFNAVQVDKATHEITAGTATATISGTTVSGASYSFTGTVTFIGNKRGTIAIQGGGTYSFTWQ